MENLNKKSSGKALVPFLIFIIVYMGTGLVLQAQGVEMAFYQLPAPVAALVAIIFAFIVFKGSIDEKFNTFIKGCGDENIIIMCIIYILAGAFSTVSGAMGAVGSTVNFALSLIPAQFITPGIFIISCFISLSTGTSVGTIVAVGPIAVGLAEKGGLSMPLVIAALVGGAMFGDNLSVISDTTISATRTQNVEMRDKFRLNILMALPAAVLTVILLIIFGKPIEAVGYGDISFNIVKMLPYILVLVTALMGVNVFVVLTAGILSSGIIGMLFGDFTLLVLGQQIYNGFTGMFEIFLLSILIGGLAKMVADEGGIQWLLNKIRGMITGRKSAEIGIAALVSLTDVATANNTVAIIIDGPIAKEICNEYKVDPRRSASLLDSFSCVMQGLIPYGAQMLIAVGFTNGVVSPFQVMPLLWYQFLLGLFAIVSIYIPFTDGVIRKDPWNFEHDMPESKVSAKREA
ncbi:Na+/H+ antiporter NhaC family protein [Tissierella sp. Yu-01]|uniref:Na+/H+ antiporter NhaC family protein n=1 Tax=Tissierella sp. Yu-01 TaxID=3035694 RepID=UPI00240DD938|nr:Na+/H+ antiporter NhaC family protein [Tissierella sp. Yu-01]WFA08607.1 Na+/H+ antiporter NhaC family protein [Tissierella sp. Yu-01]